MSDAPAQLGPRGVFRLLVDRTVGAWFWGKLIATIGVWMHGMVAAVLVHDVTGSSTAVALVTVAQFGPQAALSPIAGRWADGVDASRLMTVGRLLCVTGSGGIAAYLAFADDPGSRAVLIAVLVGSFLTGCGFAIAGPAQQAVVSSIIRPGELSKAMLLNTLPMTVSRAIGPVFGAVVATTVGAAAGFCLAALAQAINVVCVAVARFPKAEPRQGADRRFRAAWAFVRSDRTVATLLVLIAVIGVGADPSITLAPATSELFTDGTAMVGSIALAFGVGAVGGMVALGAIVRVLSPRVTLLLALAALCVGPVVVAASAWIAMALGGFVLAGAGFGVAMSSASTLLQERLPAEFRGRVMAMWMVAFVGSRPIGGPILGLLADWWSVRWSFVVLAVLTALAAALTARQLSSRPLEEKRYDSDRFRDRRVGGRPIGGERFGRPSRRTGARGRSSASVALDSAAGLPATTGHRTRRTPDP